jgi:hypothetical protein
MFAGKLDTVVINDDELGEVRVSIRKLSDKSLRKAAEARSIEQAVALKTMGGEIFRVLQSKELDAVAEKVSKPDAEKLRQERYSRYDRDYILQAGVESWSCQATYPLTPETLQKLDPPTATKLHEAIVDWTLGPVDEDEAAAVPKGV